MAKSELKRYVRKTRNLIDKIPNKKPHMEFISYNFLSSCFYKGISADDVVSNVRRGIF